MYSIVLVSTCSILAILYGGLWLWLRKRVNADFAKTLTVCMFLFNSFVLVRYGVGRLISSQYCLPFTEGCQCTTATDGTDIYCQPDTLHQIGGVAWGLAIIIYLLAFNVGSWYFGFYYYRCASEMNIVVKSTNTGGVASGLTETQTKNQKIFVIGAIINALVVLAYGGVIIYTVTNAFLFYKFMNTDAEKLELFWAGLRTGVWLAQVSSFIFLLISTFQIR
jgi:hypothetical protein